MSLHRVTLKIQMNFLQKYKLVGKFHRNIHPIRLDYKKKNWIYNVVAIETWMGALSKEMDCHV